MGRYNSIPKSISLLIYCIIHYFGVGTVSKRFLVRTFSQPPITKKETAELSNVGAGNEYPMSEISKFTVMLYFFMFSFFDL